MPTIEQLAKAEANHGKKPATTRLCIFKNCRKSFKINMLNNGQLMCPACKKKADRCTASDRFAKAVVL